MKESDGKTELVIIKRTESKAFSAGDDIKILSTKSPDDEKLRTDYLNDDYQLIYFMKIFRFKRMFKNGISYFTTCHEFYEGVRAVLINKDNKPQWQPNLLENISDEYILHHFKKLSSNEEFQLS